MNTELLDIQMDIEALKLDIKDAQYNMQGLLDCARYIVNQDLKKELKNHKCWIIDSGSAHGISIAANYQLPPFLYMVYVNDNVTANATNQGVAIHCSDYKAAQQLIEEYELEVAGWEQQLEIFLLFEAIQELRWEMEEEITELLGGNDA